MTRAHGGTRTNCRLTAQTPGEDSRLLGYDPRGNITAILDSHHQLILSYDALSRLTAANDPSFTQSWTFDANGNRLSQTDGGSATSYGIDPASNRLVQVNNTAYQYDANGNLIHDGVRIYTYDAKNRLVRARVRVKDKLVTIGEYQHNALDQRVRKVVGSTTTLFVYDEHGRLIGEYNALGNPRQETVWLGDLPVATVQNGQPYAIHTDHLGTPRVITDGSGTEVWRWDSDPYGTTAANEDPDGDGVKLSYNLRFPGQYFDAETGLHYNYFRDYDPSLGRYITSDPIGLEGGLNTYTYAENNPIRLVDVLGLCAASGMMQQCLDEIFDEPVDNVQVIIDPAMIYRHFGEKPDGTPRRGATTRPGKIYINLSCDEFWRDPRYVLHEYYHVVQQWGHEGMTRPGYILRFMAREREAWDFADKNVKEFKECLSRCPGL